MLLIKFVSLSKEVRNQSKQIKVMKEFKFRFYIGGKFKFQRIFKAETLSQAWKMAHREASDYPARSFIEIANI